MNLDFCGIDFETACRFPSSACSVGLVRVRDGAITETFYSLINPPSWMYFLDAFTDIHGLTRDDVSSSPTFDAVWGRMREFIGDDYLVAHNAPFDRGVLAGCLEYYKIGDDVPQFDCSLKAARRKWPALQNHKLDTVSEYLGIELNHHEALSDAIACAKIFVAAS
ncbi:MAG TPA: 3'-5' exonuclease [Treponemataceae bacterium]|nr:3'-5' exonuclease [Treponemataceae bacterium]